MKLYKRNWNSESIPCIDKSQTQHSNNRPRKNWVGHFQWENVFLLGWILGQIFLFSKCDSKFFAICGLHKWIRGQVTQVVQDKALFCDWHCVSSHHSLTNLYNSIPLSDKGKLVISKDIELSKVFFFFLKHKISKASPCNE